MANHRKGTTEARTVKRYEHFNKLNNATNRFPFPKDRARLILRTVGSVIDERGRDTQAGERIDEVRSLLPLLQAELDREERAGPIETVESKRNNLELVRRQAERLHRTMVLQSANEPAPQGGTTPIHLANDVLLGFLMIVSAYLERRKRRGQSNTSKSPDNP